MAGAHHHKPTLLNPERFSTLSVRIRDVNAVLVLLGPGKLQQNRECVSGI